MKPVKQFKVRRQQATVLPYIEGVAMRVELYNSNFIIVAPDRKALADMLLGLNNEKLIRKNTDPAIVGRRVK